MRSCHEVALGNCRGDSLRGALEACHQPGSIAVTDRITREIVTFSYPFEPAEGKQPAGTYTIETIEEPIDSVSFVAYRRVSTTIVLASQKYGRAS